MHPLSCDKPGQKMTSPSSVADQWSISAHSRNIHEPEKKKNKKTFSLSQHGVWVAMFGSFITSKSLCVNVDKWTNENRDVEVLLAGMGGMCWVLWFLRRDSLLVLPVQSSIWLCVKYLINSWNISSALHALISNWTQACCCIICMSVYNDGSDSGDKKNPLVKLKILSIHFPQTLIKHLWRETIPVGINIHLSLGHEENISVAC